MLPQHILHDSTQLNSFQLEPVSAQATVFEQITYQLIHPLRRCPNPFQVPFAQRVQCVGVIFKQRVRICGARAASQCTDC